MPFFMFLKLLLHEYFIQSEIFSNYFGKRFLLVKRISQDELIQLQRALYLIPRL